MKGETPDGRMSAEEIVRRILSEPEKDPLAMAMKLCAGDELKLDEVLGLLHELSTEDPLGAGSEGPKDELIGKTIGGYKIKWRLGSGGNGDVYLATRVKEPHQRVAMKLLHDVDSDQFLRRFLRERQIVALLSHPGIVKLFAADTTKGRPYFVMEYVAGSEFDKYANAERLTVKERLTLFLKLCDAVQYLHQNLIVHRDIKPGNILVEAGGVPKVLDFGIAKLLRPEMMDGDLITFTNQHPLTPQYASPEQWEGRMVTTSSDVYSLGVVLFLLLAGRLPFLWPAKNTDEYRRLVCENNVPKMSPAIAEGHAAACKEAGTGSLAATLAGDLDAIVRKALEKDVTERYATVLELAEDIRRHMEHLPVRAQGDSRIYHARRFVRRHRVPVLATVAVMVALAVGLGFALHEAGIARQQTTIADAKTAEAKKQEVEALREAERITRLDDQRQAMVDSLDKRLADQTLQGEQLRASIRELTAGVQIQIDTESRDLGKGRGDAAANKAELLRGRGRNYELLGRLLSLSGDRNGAHAAYESCVISLTSAQRAGDFTQQTSETVSRCQAGR